MGNNVREYMHAIANGYILMITVILPLYMREGLILLGDAKYSFYLRFSLLFLILFLAGAVLLGAAAHTNSKAGKGRFRSGKKIFEKKAEYKSDKNFWENIKGKWSSTDIFVVLYGAATLLSYALSSYRDTALYGYVDWHMGLVTQLLLLWGYFFISRFYDGSGYVWIGAGAAAFLVFGIGLLNRYGYDPLGCYEILDAWDKSRINMISTIGNINWYCGYVSLMLPLMFWLFWKGTRWARAAGGVGSALGLATLFTQGSMSGYIALGGILTVLLYFSLGEKERLVRFLQILLMTAFMPVAAQAMVQLQPRGIVLSAEDMAYKVLCWKGWPVLILITAILLLAGLWWRKNGRDGSRGFRRGVMGCVLGILAAGAVFFLFCQISEDFWRRMGGFSFLRIDREWGTERGKLWMASLECFREGSLKQKLLGTGPDCYGCIMNEKYGSEVWWSAANAHNEWLNMLVTGGVLGAVTYLGIFLSALGRFWHRAEAQPFQVLGLMMTVGYMVNNIFGFQQVIVTPMMFVVLGMMESVCHRNVSPGSERKSRRRFYRITGK